MDWPWQAESEEDSVSRENLLVFFSTTRLVLQTLFDRLKLLPSLKDKPAIDRLEIVRSHAFEKVEEVLQMLY